MASQDGLLSLTVLLAETALVLAAIGVVVGYLYRRAFKEVRRFRSAEQQVRGDRVNYFEYVRGKLEKLATKQGIAEPESARPLHTTLSQRSMTPHQLGLEMFREFLASEVRATRKAMEGSANFWSIRHGETRSLLKSFDAAAAAMENASGKAAGKEAEHDQDARAQAHRDDARIAQLQQRLAKRDARIHELQHEVKQLEDYRSRFLELHGSAVAELGAHQAFRTDLRQHLEQGDDGEQVQAVLEKYESQRTPHEKLVGRYDMYFTEGTEDPMSDESEKGRPDTEKWQSTLYESQNQIDASTERMRKALEEQTNLIAQLRENLEKASEKEAALRQYFGREIKQLERSIQENHQTLKSLENENYRLKRRIRRLMASNEKDQTRSRGRNRMEDALGVYTKQALDAQARVKVLEAQLAQAQGENAQLRQRLAGGGGGRNGKGSVAFGNRGTR